MKIASLKMWYFPVGMQDFSLIRVNMNIKTTSLYVLIMHNWCCCSSYCHICWAGVLMRTPKGSTMGREQTKPIPDMVETLSGADNDMLPIGAAYEFLSLSVSPTEKILKYFRLLSTIGLWRGDSTCKSCSGDGFNYCCWMGFKLVYQDHVRVAAFTMIMRGLPVTAWVRSWECGIHCKPNARSGIISLRFENLNRNWMVRRSPPCGPYRINNANGSSWTAWVT